MTGFLEGCFSYGDNSVWGAGDYSRLLLKASAHNTYAETTLIIVRDRGVDWVFASNMNFSGALEPVRLYRRRWNIETGHRCKGEARIKTKSLLPAVRYFLILAALILYDVWKLLLERPQFKRLLMGLDDMEDSASSARRLNPKAAPPPL